MVQGKIKAMEIENSPFPNPEKWVILVAKEKTEKEKHYA